MNNIEETQKKNREQLKRFEFRYKVTDVVTLDKKPILIDNNTARLVYDRQEDNYFIVGVDGTGSPECYPISEVYFKILI